MSCAACLAASVPCSASTAPVGVEMATAATVAGLTIIALVLSSHICDDVSVAGIELHDEIVEWMSGLDTAEWDRTVAIIDRLADLGSLARMPFSKALSDGLFELRFALGPTARRITYRFTKDNRIVLLTTFRKQRNNERSEIKRARQIADECARLNP